MVRAHAQVVRIRRPIRGFTKSEGSRALAIKVMQRRLHVRLIGEVPFCADLKQAGGECGELIQLLRIGSGVEETGAGNCYEVRYSRPLIPAVAEQAVNHLFRQREG